MDNSYSSMEEINISKARILIKQAQFKFPYQFSEVEQILDNIFDLFCNSAFLSEWSYHNIDGDDCFSNEDDRIILYRNRGEYTALYYRFFDGYAERALSINAEKKTAVLKKEVDGESEGKQYYWLWPYGQPVYEIGVCHQDQEIERNYINI